MCGERHTFRSSTVNIKKQMGKSADNIKGITQDETNPPLNLKYKIFESIWRDGLSTLS